MKTIAKLISQLKTFVERPSASNEEEQTGEPQNPEQRETLQEYLSITFSGFYENEKLDSIKKYFSIQEIRAVYQKGYSEELGYLISKR